MTRWHPGYADELAAGLASVVPLPAELGVFAASSSAAFGAIAMSPKRSATEFAEALVHELQHSKVNALFELVTLFHPQEGLLYAPWLDEPRGLAGLLHGIYAFVSVVEFWDLQRRLVPPAETRRAQFALGLRANQLGRVIGIVQGRPELTELGREFVAAVAGRLAARTPVEIPPDIDDAIATLTADHYATWRIRHVHPPADQVERLAEDWLAGRTAEVESHEDRIVPGRPSRPSPRPALLKLRALEPDRFDRLPQDGPDTALVRGDHGAAATGYRQRVRALPTDASAWAGLALATDSGALLRRPELVSAVYHRISARTGTVPDPVGLANWFDRGRQPAG